MNFRATGKPGPFSWGSSWAQVLQIHIWVPEHRDGICCNFVLGVFVRIHEQLSSLNQFLCVPSPWLFSLGRVSEVEFSPWAISPCWLLFLEGDNFPKCIYCSSWLTKDLEGVVLRLSRRSWGICSWIFWHWCCLAWVCRPVGLWLLRSWWRQTFGIRVLMQIWVCHLLPVNIIKCGLLCWWVLPASCCLQKAKGELSLFWVNIYRKVIDYKMLWVAMVLNIVFHVYFQQHICEFNSGVMCCSVNMHVFV